MKQFSTRKKLLFYVLALSSGLLIIELTLRVSLFFRIGPEYFLYGTKFCCKTTKLPSMDYKEKPKFINQLDDLSLLENKIIEYNKYFPYQKRKMLNENGDLIEITMNNHGMRGKDFDIKKKEGAVRIITLGESSTFGYYNADEQTYPYILEKILNQKLKGQPNIEIINFGLPGLNSEQILALFNEEALKLEPDIITLYAGINDTNILEPKNEFFKKLTKKFLIFAIGHYTLIKNAGKFTINDFNYYHKKLSPQFFKNLKKINEECQKHGIILILANQQSRSRTIDNPNELRNTTFEDEAIIIRNLLLHKKNWLNEPEMRFILHVELMKNLKLFAAENKIPFVDLIKALDENRNHIISWVHLDTKANKIIALNLANEILHQLGNNSLKFNEN